MDEFCCDVLKMSEDFAGAFDDSRLVVLDTMRSAELLRELTNLMQIVARGCRKEVVLDLVIQPSAEPVNKSETILRDVASRRDLELPKVRPSVGIVDRHAVMTCGEDSLLKRQAKFQLWS